MKTHRLRRRDRSTRVVSAPGARGEANTRADCSRSRRIAAPPVDGEPMFTLPPPKLEPQNRHISPRRTAPNTKTPRAAEPLAPTPFSYTPRKNEPLARAPPHRQPHASTRLASWPILGARAPHPHPRLQNLEHAATVPRNAARHARRTTAAHAGPHLFSHPSLSHPKTYRTRAGISNSLSLGQSDDDAREAEREAAQEATPRPHTSRDPARPQRAQGQEKARARPASS